MSGSVDQAAERGTAPSTVQVIDDVDALPALFAEWDDLLARSPDGSAYLSRAWVEPWWRHFGGPTRRLDVRSSTPHVVVVRDAGGRLAALLPWLEVRLGPVERLLVGIGQETADYGGVLLGDRPQEVLPLVLDHLELELGRGRTLIDLTRLHPDGVLLGALRRRFTPDGRYVLRPHLTTPYPCIDLRSAADPAALVHRLARRNDVLRRERRLEEQHPIDFAFHRPGRSSADLATFLELHRRRWATRPTAPDGIFATPSGQAFLVDAAAALDEAGLLRLSILRAGSRPVVGRFGTVFAGAYQGMKSGWDPDFAAFGPGHLAVARVLRHLVDEGVGEMDLLRGRGDHKSAWMTGERLVSYWTLGRADRWSGLDRRGLWTVLRLRNRGRR